MKRKAAATLRVEAHGRSVALRIGAGARAGAPCSRWRRWRRLVAACSDPDGPDRLTAVPTILRSGEAFNVVPAAGELLCDLRADRLEAFDPVLEAVPGRARRGAARGDDGARLAGNGLARGHGARCSRPPREALGRPIVGSERGGASDASHMAAGGIELTIDGLGPRGGGAHAPHEWVSAESLRTRAEVALAVTAALLEDGLDALDSVSRRARPSSVAPRARPAARAAT